MWLWRIIFGSQNVCETFVINNSWMTKPLCDFEDLQPLNHKIFLWIWRFIIFEWKNVCNKESHKLWHSVHKFVKGCLVISLHGMVEFLWERYLVSLDTVIMTGGQSICQIFLTSGPSANKNLYVYLRIELSDISIIFDQLVSVPISCVHGIKNNNFKPVQIKLKLLFF